MHKTKDSEFRTPSLEQKKEEGCMHEHTTNSEFEACSPEQKIDVISNLRKKYNTAKFTTLEDALEAFGLPSLLQDLDNNLEMVRKNKESTEGHEKYINEKVYKRLKDLSRKYYHPDKIQQEGGSEEDITKAKELFQVLDSVKAIIGKLHESVLEDVSFRYSFYSKMEVSLLGNAQELEQLNFKILVELCRLSDIRQGKLVPNINKFLKFSQSSMEKFIKDDQDSFIEERNKALACCSLYVDDYESLIEKLKSVKRGCETDKDLSYIEPSIDKMLSGSGVQLNILKQLKKLSRDLTQGKLQPFRAKNYKDADEYFVLPFVEYINALLMCSKVCAKEKELSQIGEKSEGIIQKIKSTKREIKDGIRNVLWGKSESNEDSDIYEEEERIADLYKASLYLMRWYCDGKTDEEWLKKNVLGREANKISCEEVRKEFTNIIAAYYKDYLAKEFRPEDYIGISKITELINTCKELGANIQKAQDEQEKIRAGQEKIRADQEEIRTNLKEIKVNTRQVKKQMRKASINAPQVEKLLQDTERNTNTIEHMTQILKGTTKKQEKTSASQQQNARATNNQQGAQASGTQSDQQHDPNAQPMSRSRPSSPSGSNDDQSRPSSKLDEVPPISRSQSMNSLHSSDSDIKIDSSSQFR